MFRTSSLQGLSISRQSPAITHLLFANNSILFSKAISMEAGKICGCLYFYSKASVQLINFHKSSIMFGSNTSQMARESITNIMNIRNLERHEKFLGLPTLFS